MLANPKKVRIGCLLLGATTALAVIVGCDGQKSKEEPAWKETIQQQELNRQGKERPQPPPQQQQSPQPPAPRK